MVLLMNLQKNDKIIAVVGVIVLIVAAIGIVLYYPTEEDDTLEPITEDELIEYMVNYEVTEEMITPENTNYVVKDKIIGNGDYQSSFEVSEDNLKEVEIFVEYTDTRTGRLLKLFSQDTLSVIITDEDENEIGTMTFKGSGNDTLTISGSAPESFVAILAKNPNEAREKLIENLTMMETGLTEKYNIQVSLNNGENIILRPLRWLLEKIGSDGFNLEITAYHYYYDIVEPLTDDNDDGDDTEMSINKDDLSTATYYQLNNLGFK